MGQGEGEERERKRSMSRDNWARLLAAVLKREQYLQLCYKESRSPSICSFSSDSTEEILDNNWESISGSSLRNSQVFQASDRASSTPIITKKHVRMKAEDEYSVDLPELQLGGLRRFFLHELLVATHNFNDENILQRASNSIYDGCLVDGSRVAVKRFKYGGGSDQDVEFQNEVEINSITAHPNVLGFCIAPKERLLVYRLMASESPSLGFTGPLEESFSRRGHLHEFSLDVLLKATNNFSEEFKIGRVSFGSVYHATLDDGRRVTIKRVEVSAPPSDKGKMKTNNNEFFSNELEFNLSRVNHKNLARLLGFCEECNERVLVYEYMYNGTLFDQLHNNFESSELVSWPKRIKVALDVARGIEYLHDYAVPRVIHRDIKSANILLDATWTAKVSDFGLCAVGPQGEEPHLYLEVDVVVGTFGYVDPECLTRDLVATTKNDVYSFGVVLLELLSGCKAIHMSEDGEQKNVVGCLVPYIIQGYISRVLDPRMPPPGPLEIKAMADVACLGANCVAAEGRDRPSMREVANSLDRALATWSTT